ATSTTTYLLQAISIYFLILGLNSFISLEEIFVVFPVSQFAAALSFVPGGVGVFEGGMIGLLVLFNLPYDVAITTTILIRLIGTGLFTAIGMICLKIISKEK
ncbi:MAG: flippase-like domain-containing protein, partial [Bacteroidetes bacterium]|nr:flippase-like domain-containing protein [Bacteroidota bacterium]